MRASVSTWLAGVGLFLAACGNGTSSTGDASGGSAQGAAGNASGGISANDGGAPSAGGSFGSGGASQGGSQSQQGGVATNGGNPTSGGSLAAGGSNEGTGGAKSTTGGVSSATTGGKATTGGTSGGALNPGGKSGSGGASANGGTSTAGGTMASGGKSSGGSGGRSGSTPITVWIAGDSTVQNCSSTCPCGWGSQFDPLFNASVTVQNSAVGGRSIQTWLYEANVSSTLTNGECALTADTYNARWTAMLNATSGMKAGDYLFIQFGINDGDSACPRHVGQALFKKYLGVMAQAAKDRGAQPIFVTPVSAISCSSAGKAVGTRGAFVTTTIDAGTTFDVPVIDLHQRSVDLYNSLGFCPNDEDYSSGTLGAFFCEDHTHFEAAGAVQIAKLVAAALREQKIGLSAYLL